MSENNVVDQQSLDPAIVQALINRRQECYPQFFNKPIADGAIPQINLSDKAKIFPPEFYLQINLSNKIGLLEELWVAEQNLFSGFINFTKGFERIFIYTERGWYIQTLNKPAGFYCWNMFSLTCLPIKSDHLMVQQATTNIMPIKLNFPGS